jgi:hypothetical protein
MAVFGSRAISAMEGLAGAVVNNGLRGVNGASEQFFGRFFRRCRSGAAHGLRDDHRLQLLLHADQRPGLARRGLDPRSTPAETAPRR